MRLENKSKWEHEGLRNFLEKIVKELGYDMTGWRILVGHNSRRVFNGRISHFEKLIRLNVQFPLPEFWGKKYKNSTRTLAFIFIHELRHRGIDNHSNSEIDDSYNWNLAENFVPDGFELPLKKPYVRPKRNWEDIKKDRYEKILKRIENKEMKLKGIQRSLKKLYQKRKYYEKTIL